MSLRKAAVLFASCAGFMACTFGALANPQISVLSSRPDTVSGGDALLQIAYAPGEQILRVELNGANVASDFQPGSQPNTLMGLVSGLQLGANLLVAQSNHGWGGIELNNHPISGPIFSGPHEEPFYCMTQNFPVPGNSSANLGPALDANCSIATRVDYVYMSTSGSFKALPNMTGYPPDLATATTTQGVTVPYIVRVETGTIDRAIYQTAVLFDPSKNPAPTAFNPPPAWNQKLVYTFGGGCPGGWYIQGASIGNSNGVLEDLLLRQGYGVASSTLNVFGNNCNDVLAAESLSMVKERFIKNFGPVLFTMGWGCSAGSEGENTAGDSYPGLLDGIVTGCNFTDPGSTLMLPNTDARLFSHYLADTSVSWSSTQILAAAGVSSLNALTDMGSIIGQYTAVEDGKCNAAIPTSTIFNQTTNPTGVRCDYFDHNRNIYGVDPKTGYALRTFDNVGVQYGLKALNAGQITTQEFIDLNQNIGGFDDNGNFVPTRAAADPRALSVAYQSNRVTFGGLGLRTTPIIDYRAYEDLGSGGIEQHQREQSFMLRARLLAANGDFNNEVMLVESPFYGNFSDTSPVVQHALTQMDEWLTNLRADNSNARPSVRLQQTKPSDLVDACFTSNGTVKIAETQVDAGNTTCNQLYPPHSSPREVSGMPLANNVLKCQLKPIDPSDYTGVTMTHDDYVQLEAIFPHGVCDWKRPGVEQQLPQGVWLSFGPNPTHTAGLP